MHTTEKQYKTLSTLFTVTLIRNIYFCNGMAPLFTFLDFDFLSELRLLNSRVNEIFI